MRNWDEVENYFIYHAPSADTKPVHEAIGTEFLRVAKVLWDIVEPKGEGSPDKTVMFRQLSDARIAANMAVACYVNPKKQTGF